MWQPRTETPTSGTPFVSEANELSKRLPRQSEYKHPYDVLRSVTFARWLALIDYLRGVALVAAQGWTAQRRVVFSGAPIARAALEALAYIHWLCEPDIGPNARMMRVVWDVHQSIGARGRLHDHRPGDWKSWDPGWSDFADILTAWGVEHRRGGRAPHPVIIEDHTERRDAAFDILLRGVMRSRTSEKVGAFFYSDLTDLAHASVDGVLRRADIQVKSEGALHLKFSREKQLHGLVGLPWAVPVPAESVMSLMGWDTAPVREVFARELSRLAELAGPPPSAADDLDPRRGSDDDR